MSARAAQRIGFLLVLAGVVLVGIAGCDRKPRFVQDTSDSTATAVSDTFSSAVQAARSGWEAGGEGDGTAASATARVVLADLRAHRDRPIELRARAFLDSTGFGAEISGRGEVAIVNFFALADPDGGSWPYLFWRRGSDVRSQAVEGSGMRLLDVAVRTSPDSITQAAALFTRSAGSGQQPLVVVWRRPAVASQWSLHQMLGPDSLGGVGTARFVVPPGPDSIALETRTWTRTPMFDECPSCPHVFRSRSFRWTSAGFGRVAEQVDDTPYLAFVRFIQAMTVPDWDLARERVTEAHVLDDARALGLTEKKGVWRVAPGTEEPGADMTFFRGAREAYRVRFARGANGWAITSIESANRAIE